MRGGAWVVDWDVVAGLALGTGVKGALLLSCVAGLALALRSGSAARRHLVWSLGMVGLLALPVLQMAAPRWSVEVTGPGWLERSAVAASGAPRAPRAPLAVETADGIAGVGGAAGAGGAVGVGGFMEDGEVVAGGQGAAGGEAVDVGEVGEAGAAPGVRRAAERPAAASGVESRRSGEPALGSNAATPGWPFLLLAVWGCGALLLGGAVLASHAALRRLERSARPFPGDRVARELSHLAVVMGVGRPVHILEGGDGQMPMSWGLFRSVILLPRGADRWPTTRLRAVLLHELAHVRRRDCLTQVVAELACAFHWPNPLAWIAVRRLRVEREHACDDRVLEAGARASAYADELVSLARGFRAEARGSLAAVAMARPSNLESRVRAVLAEGRRRALTRRGAAVIAAVAFLLTTAVAGVSAVPAPADSDGAVPRSTEGSGATDGAAAGLPERPDSAARTPAPASGPTTLPQEVSCGAERADWSSSTHRRNDDRTRISWSRPGCEVDVLLVGEVEFDDGFDDVARLGPDARFRIEEVDGGTERRLEMTPGPGGAPRVEYVVDREERPFDAQARAWYGGILLQVFRRAGFLAEERVAAFLDAGGVEAVLQEMELLETDHVYARYVEETIRQAELSEARLEDLLDRAGRRVDSDHYLAGILEIVADHTELNDRMLDTYIEASRTLGSDHYRAEVLGTALDRDDLSDAQVRALLESAAGIGSDHYQGEILEGVARRYTLEAALLDIYLEALERIDSDHYRHGALRSVLLTADGWSEERLRRVVEATAVIRSDHYGSEILVEIAERHPIEGAVRDAYLRAMDSIGSRHYRGRVAEALLRSGG